MAKYVFEKLPSNAEEFKASPYLDLTNHHNTFAMFIAALSIYVKDEAEGIECINVLRGPEPLSSYDKSFLRERIKDKTYLPMVYFAGSTPDNGYKPLEPFTINTIDDAAPQYTAGPDYRRAFVSEKGFDSPRYATMRLKKSEGKWYINEYSGILTGVRKPAGEDPWD